MCVSDVPLKTTYEACVQVCVWVWVSNREREEKEKELTLENSGRSSESWIDTIFVFSTSEAGR